VSRRLPWSSLLEVAYVGNSSHDLANTSNGYGSDINLVPVGAMSWATTGKDPNGLTANNYRPLQGFSDVDLATNNLYANYNGMQATWVRTKGRYTINMNYTWSRSMGIVNPALDPFNLSNDYGVLPTDRRHLFNAAYSVELGNPTHDRVLGAFINGWQLSGITQIESGPNLSAYQGENFGGNYNGALTNGTSLVPSSSGGESSCPGGVGSINCFAISNVALLGTNAIQLNPMLTCNPTSGLGPHQYINPNCFALPTKIGQMGPTILPPIYGPSFFNSDLGLFKNFSFTEQKKLQLRFNAYNFLNHPLWSFNGSNLSLGFSPSTGAVNTPDFGTVTTKQGNRIVQLAVKFLF